MQRASIEAAAALSSSGNSRETKRTLPVSIYFDRSMGNTFSSNAAQCGQVSEEYSMMVIGALSLPSAMSGRAGGFASSVRVCALSAWAGGGAKTALSTSMPSAARRIWLSNGLLRKPVRSAPSISASYFASAKETMRQSEAGRCLRASHRSRRHQVPSGPTKRRDPGRTEAKWPAAIDRRRAARRESGVPATRRCSRCPLLTAWCGRSDPALGRGYYTQNVSGPLAGIVNRSQGHKDKARCSGGPVGRPHGTPEDPGNRHGGHCCAIGSAFGGQAVPGFLLDQERDQRQPLPLVTRLGQQLPVTMIVVFAVLLT